MGKLFNDNNDNNMRMASEYSARFNDTEDDIEMDSPEDFDQLRKDNPGLFEGPFSIFGPRTREDIEAWDREVQRQIREGECRPFSEFRKELSKKYPWLAR